MDNIVEIKNVYKSYSKKEVISNMNLNIRLCFKLVLKMIQYI